MIVLSSFRFSVTFVLSRITNCLFLSVLLISVSKETESTRFYYFIKITCNNKCYTQISTMGAADYSKRRLNTVRFPI